jgi:hypothetical protein
MIKFIGFFSVASRSPGPSENNKKISLNNLASLEVVDEISDTNCNYGFLKVLKLLLAKAYFGNKTH